MTSNVVAFIQHSGGIRWSNKETINFNWAVKKRTTEVLASFSPLIRVNNCGTCALLTCFAHDNYLHESVGNYKERFQFIKLAIQVVFIRLLGVCSKQDLVYFTHILDLFF